MKQKGTRHISYAMVTLLLCLLTVFSFGTKSAVIRAEAATSKIKFASNVASTAKSYAKKAGATQKSKIAIVDVNNYTNVFSARSASSTIRGKLYRGTGVYIIKTKGAFCYVSSGALKGWVKKSVLLTGKKGKRLMSYMHPRVATVTATDLNVRETPSSDSDILLNVLTGTKLMVVSVNGDWARVRLTEDDYGYVYRDYTKIRYGLATGVTTAKENKLYKKIEAMRTANEVAAAKLQVSEGSSESGSAHTFSSAAGSGNWVSLGTFKLTAYCPCSSCSGGWGHQTASGATATENHTIAVDKNVIPLGSKIRIGNTVYVAEDTGVRGNTIDIFFESHSATTNFGVKYAEVYILRD